VPDASLLPFLRKRQFLPGAELPLASVSSPVYNDEATAREVAGCALPTLRDNASIFEVIIVDDGSPDNAGNIAEPAHDAS
jgi:glycosyltransferase involved in cell wall biosynthesis